MLAVYGRWLAVVVLVAGMVVGRLGAGGDGVVAIGMNKCRACVNSVGIC